MNFEWNKNTYAIKIWSNEFLGSNVVVDTETEVVPFTETPDLVTYQAYGGGDTGYYVPKNKIRLFINKHYDAALIFHNAKFDVDVIHKHLDDKLLYSHYDRDLIFDTAIMYQLLQLAVTGQVPFKRSLQFLTAKFLGINIEKDERRENFAQFINTPIEEIPSEYLEYGMIDVIATYQIFNKLKEYIARHDKMGTMLSHHIQVKGDLALNAIYKNGIGFSIDRRDTWMVKQKEELEIIAMRLSDWGLIRGLKGYKQTYKHIIENLLQLPIPYRYKKIKCKQLDSGSWIYDGRGLIDVNGHKIRVEEGMTTHGEPSISSQREDLEEYYDTHSFIKDFLDFMETEKQISFTEHITDRVIHPRYNLLMNTGRTSCTGGKTACNLQQMPRGGEIRSFFEPKKKGNVFVDVDYSSIELAGLAQVCLKEFGYSKMGELINEGKCLHYYTASQVYRKPESKITKDERQFSKIPNFAFPTNMSPATFIDYCRGYKVPMTLAQSTDLKNSYAQAYPEISENFWKVDNNDLNVYTLTGRRRANCTYTSFLNTKFQGLCADGLKLAMYALLKEGYEMVCEIHDQVLIEIEEERAEEEMPKIEKIMVDAMKKVIPDIKVSTEGQIVPRFCK